MKFTVKNANDVINGEVEDALSEVRKMSNIPDVYDVTGDSLMKNNKKPLADCLAETTGTLSVCKEFLIEAISQLDELKSNQILLQKQLIETQQELVKSKTEQLQSFQTAVRDEPKTESKPVKSYCEAAEKGVLSRGAVITADQVKNAVKCAVQEEDRTKNIIVFGVTENEEEGPDSKILDVFESLDEKPRITECVRLGSKKEGVVRPVKVTLGSSESVHRVLSRAGQLKGFQQYRGVYLSADRTRDERLARKNLVEQLKQKREAEPEHYHFIRNDIILSRRNMSVTVS